MASDVIKTSCAVSQSNKTRAALSQSENRKPCKPILCAGSRWYRPGIYPREPWSRPAEEQVFPPKTSALQYKLQSVRRGIFVQVGGVGATAPGAGRCLPTFQL